MDFISTDTIELIGRVCPLLKSLEIFINLLSKFIGFNDNAIAIEKLMSGLRHLKIAGNRLTSVGMVAIFKGCKLLQSLNLQHFGKLVFTTYVRDKCMEQIKNFKFPPGYLQNVDDQLEFLDDCDYYSHYGSD